MGSEGKGRRLSRLGFIAVLGLVAVVFLVVVRRFLLPAFLAAITVGILRPVEERAGRITGGREWLSAALATTAVVLLLLIPFSGVAYLAAEALIDLAPRITQAVGDVEGAFDRLVSRLPAIPLVDQGLRVLLGEEGLTGALERTLTTAAGEATSFAQETPQVVLLIFVYLYCLYYFFKDGKAIMRTVVGLVPLETNVRGEILKKTTSVTRGVLKGSVLVGILEGIILGTTMALLGVPGALLWAVLLVFLAIIPGIGPVLIYLPASVGLFVSGQTVGGIILLLVGIGPVGAVDTFLRPYLIGEDLKLHKVLILFGVIGGILVFGLFGFIIGPVVVAIFVELLKIYRETYQQELQEIDARGAD